MRSRIISPRCVALACLCGLLIAAPAAGQSTLHDVVVNVGGFMPTGTVVAPGDTVRWTVASGAHEIESDSTSAKAWSTGYIDTPGQNFQIVFHYDDGPGPFPYHCLYHANRDTIFVTEACFATGVVLRDGPMSVADVVYATRLIAGDITPSPDALYRLDLTGDCVVDAFDLELFNCFFQSGLGCFDVYPVPTCCFPVLHTSSCPIPVTGDMDTSGTVSANDIVSLVSFMFRNGPDPEPCVATADVNCSGDVTASDVIFMVNYVFKGGPRPATSARWYPTSGPAATSGRTVSQVAGG